VIYNAGLLTVTPLTLNFAQGPTTTYNGSTNIVNATLTPSNTVAGDNLTVSGSGTLTSPNASSGNASYSMTSAILSGPDAANYLFLPSGSGASGTNATVLPAPITVSASNAVKTYDTTTVTSGASVSTAPTPVIVSGALFTNTVTGANDLLSSVATVYQDSNAGTGNKTLVVSSALINNGSLNATSNYVITYVINTTSTINKAPLTVSGLSANNLVYNGGTAGTVSGTPTLVGAIGGASVSISSGTVTQGNFASANAGNGIAVTPDLSGLVLSNPNYEITSTSTPLLASITPAP